MKHKYSEVIRNLEIIETFREAFVLALMRHFGYSVTPEFMGSVEYFIDENEEFILANVGQGLTADQIAVSATEEVIRQLNLGQTAVQATATEPALTHQAVEAVLTTPQQTGALPNTDEHITTLSPSMSIAAASAQRPTVTLLPFPSLTVSKEEAARAELEIAFVQGLQALTLPIIPSSAVETSSPPLEQPESVTAPLVAVFDIGQVHQHQPAEDGAVDPSPILSMEVITDLFVPGPESAVLTGEPSAAPYAVEAPIAQVGPQQALSVPTLPTVNPLLPLDDQTISGEPNPASSPLPSVTEILSGHSVLTTEHLF